MRSEAYKITGFTAVISALGFLIRWLQDLKIYDENGLPDRWAHINFWVIGIMLVTAAVLLVFVRALKRCEAPRAAEEAMLGHTFLYPALGYFAAGLLMLAGFAGFIKAGDSLYPTLRRFLGLFAMAGAVGAALLTRGTGKKEKSSSRSLGAALLALFGCLWLIVVYKENAAQPAIWSFLVEILALCAAIAAFYFVAGYQLGQPSPYAAIFFCYLTVFLCAMSVVDSNGAADSMAYAAVAVLTGLWGFTLTENLHRPPQEAQKQYKL
jgi:hypothetical protein